MKTKTLEFRLQDKGHFEAIKRRLKTVETRAASEKYCDIKPGDSVSFRCSTEEVVMKVQAVEHYSSIEKLLDEIPIDRLMPGLTTLEEVKKAYRGYPGYEQKIAQHGLIALFL